VFSSESTAEVPTKAGELAQTAAQAGRLYASLRKGISGPSKPFSSGSEASTRHGHVARMAAVREARIGSRRSSAASRTTS